MTAKEILSFINDKVRVKMLLCYICIDTEPCQLSDLHCKPAY